MAEQTQVVVPEVTVNPFSGSWTETPTVVETAPVKPVEPIVEKTEAAPVPPVEPAKPTEPEEEILDPKDWLKREFEVDDPAILKAEREELKKLKETVSNQKEFTNEQSKHIYELLREGKIDPVREFLDTQSKLEKFLSADVSKDTAGDIIKMGMQLKYKDLTPSEIEYKYRKEFGIPQEPVISADETEEEFTARHAAWTERVSDIETAKVIEAKLIKPELEKAKANLSLPEISKPAPPVNEPDAQKLQEIRDNFLAALESNYSKAEGFETKVKDESVEIPVSFKIPDEEKIAIKDRLKEGFDVNQYIDGRWFDENGTPKIEQIVKDIYQLENLEKILSGVSNNAAALRLVEFQKQAKNIDVSGTAQQTFTPSTNGQKGVNPFSKDAWSETPAVLTT